MSIKSSAPIIMDKSLKANRNFVPGLLVGSKLSVLKLSSDEVDVKPKSI